MRLRILLLAVAVSATLQICGATPNPRTHVYFVEYLTPVRGAEGVYTLNVVFFRRVSSRAAESMLRGEIERILLTFPPDGNILASAWFSRNGDEADEDLLTMPDGSQHLIYSKKLKKTITFDEYERRKK